MESKNQSKGPLDGRTILVTRQKSQAAEMVAALESLGAEVICCPMIETVAPGSWERLDASIQRINLYNWIVFTSSNAVAFFAQRMAALGCELTVLSEITSVAIGPGTAGAMRRLGIHADAVASDSKGEGALEAIVAHAGGEAKIQGQRFLLPRSAIASDVLPKALARLGADVDDVEAYTTVKPQTDLAPVLARLEQATIDAIAFTSSSTVSNFTDLIGPGRLPMLLRGVVVGCIGPATARTALSVGLTEIVQPDRHTTQALVDSLTEALIQRRASN